MKYGQWNKWTRRGRYVVHTEQNARFLLKSNFQHRQRLFVQKKKIDDPTQVLVWYDS